MAEHLLTYGYVLLFLGTAFEGEATYITAAYLAHRGHMNLWAVFGVGVAANIISTQAFYQIARWSGRHAFERKAARNPRVQRVYKWVQRRGSALVLACRFMFGFRIAVPAACGAAGMKMGRFLFLNVLGALIWGVVFGAVGFGLAGVARAMLAEMRESYEWPLAIGLFFAIALLLMLARDWHASRTLVLHPLCLAQEAIDEVSEIVDQPIRPHLHHPHHPHGPHGQPQPRRQTG